MTQSPNSLTFSGKHRLWLGGILLVYAVLGIMYMLATPPLESSDEYKHYPVVQYIETQGHLPVLDPQAPGLWLQEGVQPPLYYLLMAGLTAWIDTSDLPAVHQVNKHAFVGDPNQVGNKNIILHQPEREQFPGEGTILAIYLIRLASLGLGLGTVWLTAVLGKIAPESATFYCGSGVSACVNLLAMAHVGMGNGRLYVGSWSEWSGDPARPAATGNER